MINHFSLDRMDTDSPDTSRIRQTLTNGQKISSTLEAQLNPMYFTPKNGSRIAASRIRSNEKFKFGATEQFANEVYSIVDHDDFRQFTEFGDARESIH